MQSQGLVEVLNPSEVFLEERLDGATGSAIVVTMEGTRPILAEVQALVTPTMFGNAKRTTTGLDFNRASLIMAVLEKRAGLLLQNQDAYLKSAGGVKLDEPAIDLAVAVALASSYKDKPTNPQECFIGEIGLTGEIRASIGLNNGLTKPLNWALPRSMPQKFSDRYQGAQGNHRYRRDHHWRSLAESIQLMKSFGSDS